MRWLILYLAFGGVLMALVAGGIKKDCGYKMPITEFTLSAAAWPAMVSGAVTYLVTNGIDQNNPCTKPSN